MPEILEDPVGSVHEGIDHHGLVERGPGLRPMFLLQAGAVAGSDQQRFPDPCVPAAFQIDELVTNHVAAGEVEPEFIAGIEEELWGRFASATGLVGGFRCKIDAFQPDVVGSESLGDALVDGMHLGLGVVTPADTRLIGDDDEGEAGLDELEEGLRRAWEEDGLVRVAQVVAFFDQGAIAVQEDGWSWWVSVGHSGGRTFSAVGTRRGVLLL